jgi:hypothetical protein
MAPFSGFEVSVSGFFLAFPIAPKDIPYMGPDIAELIAVGIALVLSIGIMVVLGRWWQQ